MRDVVYADDELGFLISMKIKRKEKRDERRRGKAAVIFFRSKHSSSQVIYGGSGAFCQFDI